MSESLKVRV